MHQISQTRIFEQMQQGVFHEAARVEAEKGEEEAKKREKERKRKASLFSLIGNVNMQTFAGALKYVKEKAFKDTNDEKDPERKKRLLACKQFTDWVNETVQLSNQLTRLKQSANQFYRQLRSEYGSINFGEDLIRAVANLLANLRDHEINLFNFSSPEHQELVKQYLSNYSHSAQIVHLLYLLVVLTSVDDSLLMAGSNSAYLLNLMEKSFRRIDLSYATIRDIDLTHSLLQQSYLEGALFENVNFANSAISLAQSERCIIRNAIVSDLLINGCVHRLTDTFFISSPVQIFIASSSDQRLAAMVTENQTSFKIINLQTAQLISRIQDSSKLKLFLAFTPNGRCVVSQNFNNEIKLWDVKNGKMIRTIKMEFTVRLGFDKRGLHLEQILRQQNSTTFQIWDVAAGTVNQYFNINFAQFQPIAYTKDVTDIRLLAYAQNSSISVHFTETGMLNKQLQTPLQLITLIEFSQNTEFIAAASSQFQLSLFEIITGNQIFSTQVHKAEIKAILFAPGDKLIASAGDDSTIVLWDLSGKQLREFKHHESSVTVLAFNKEGSLLASGGGDGYVTITTTATGEIFMRLPIHGQLLHQLLFNEEGLLVVYEAQILMSKLRHRVQKKVIQKLVTNSDQSMFIKFQPAESPLKYNYSFFYSLKNELRQTASGYGTSAQFPKVLDCGNLTYEWIELTKFPEGSGPTIKTIKYLDNIPPYYSSCFSLSYSPDGSYVLAGHRDGRLRMWNPHTGSLIKQLGENGLPVMALAISPSGNLFASGSKSDEIILWDPVSATEVNRINCQEESVTALDFSHRGNYLASFMGNMSVMVWELSSRSRIRAFPSNSETRSTLKFSPIEDVLAFPVDKKAVIFVNLSNDSQTECKLDEDKITAIAFSSDATSVAIGCLEGLISLVDGATRDQVANSQKFELLECTSLAFSPDNRWLAAGSLKSQVWLLEARTLSFLSYVDTNCDPVFSIAYSPDGRTIAGSGNSFHIRFWKTAIQPWVNDFGYDQEELTSLSCSQQGEILATGSTASKVIFWQKKGFKRLRNIRGHSGTQTKVTFTKCNNMLVTGGEDGSIAIRNVLKDSVIRRFTSQQGSVHLLVLSSDSELLASAGADNSIKVWNIARSTGVSTIQVHHKLVTSMLFSSDKQFVLSASLDYTVKQSDVLTGNIVRNFSDEGAPVYAIACPPDMSLLAVGGSESYIKLYNFQTAKIESTLRGHEDKINSLCYTRDGKLLVSGSSDNTARLWDMDNKSKIKVVKLHHDEVTAVSISAESSYVVSISKDRTVRYHRLAKQQDKYVKYKPLFQDTISSLDRHIKFQKESLKEKLKDNLNMVTSPDGKLIAFCNAIGEVEQWINYCDTQLTKLQFANKKIQVRQIVYDAKNKLHFLVENDSAFLLNNVTRVVLPEGNRMLMAVSPCGKRIALSRGVHVIVVAPQSGQEVYRTQNAEGHGVRAIIFSCSGEWLGIGFTNGQVIIHDLKDQKEIIRFGENNNDEVQILAFSPNDQLLALCYAPKNEQQAARVQLRETATGAEVFSLDIEAAQVLGLAVSANNKQLACALNQKLVMLVDTRSGQVIRRFLLPNCRYQMWSLRLLESSANFSEACKGMMKEFNSLKQRSQRYQLSALARNLTYTILGYDDQFESQFSYMEDDLPFRMYGK